MGNCVLNHSNHSGAQDDNSMETTRSLKHVQESIMGNSTSDTQQQALQVQRRYLDKYSKDMLCFGYVRFFLVDIYVDDIARLVRMYTYVLDWKFDYLYDYYNQKSKIHRIKDLDNGGQASSLTLKVPYPTKNDTYVTKDLDNGKTAQCNARFECCCCFGLYSFGMRPNSGEYTIKIKINTIYSTRVNIIGIVSQNCKNISLNKMQTNKKKNIRWFDQFDDVIGWSAYYSEYDTHLRNGLYCGSGSGSHNFIYKSNNENYEKRLPPINSGDIILLSYNSNLGILSFYKSNDNKKLDAQISNLPKSNVFYWFVGHEYGQLSLTVVA